MIIHELDDAGIGLGGPKSVIGTTRCGARGEILLRDGRRFVKASSGALFALSRLIGDGAGLNDVALELDATTCQHCRKLARCRAP